MKRQKKKKKESNNGFTDALTFQAYSFLRT